MKLLKLLKLESVQLKSGKRRNLGTYECHCGNVFTAWPYNVATGATKSCGCLRRESCRALGKSLTTLGRTTDPAMRLTASAFSSMMGRCYHKGNASYPRYGAKGVTVHADLATFPKFVAYMGVRPSKAHTLDRIDNSKGYEPGNVRWATRSEQAKNRKSTRWIEWNGERKTASEWATIVGVTTSCVCRRDTTSKNPDGTPKETP